MILYSTLRIFAKRITCLIIFTYSTTPSLSQDSLSQFSMPYSNRKLIMGPFITTAIFQEFNPKAGIGVDGEYMFARNFGFGSVLAGGYNYAEVSGSVLGLFGLAAWDSSNDNLWFFLIFAPLIIENPCIHFKPNKNQEIILSLSMMKFRYIYEKDPAYGDDFFASGSLSLRYSVFYRSYWQWSFYAEGVALYHSGQPKGLQIGIALRHVSRDAVRLR